MKQKEVSVLDFNAIDWDMVNQEKAICLFACLEPGMQKLLQVKLLLHLVSS